MWLYSCVKSFTYSFCKEKQSVFKFQFRFITVTGNGQTSFRILPVNLHTCQGTNLCQLVQRTLLFRIVRVCVRVSVYVHTREFCMCLWALCLSMHRWMSEEDVDYLALLFFILFWERSFTDPWSKASGPHDSAPSPVLGLQACKWSYPAFYMSAGVSNSGFHAGVASTLTH